MVMTGVKTKKNIFYYYSVKFIFEHQIDFGFGFMIFQAKSHFSFLYNEIYQ